MDCQVHRYECGNPRHRKVIQTLREYAETQSDYFKDIFPWRNPCVSKRLVYISYTKDNQICGWMVVDPGTDGLGYRYANVTEISTANSRVRGWGKRLINELTDYDYIRLIPLPGVKSFYRHIGFEDFESPYWIRSIRDMDRTRLQEYYRTLRMESQRREKRKLERKFGKVKSELSRTYLSKLDRAIEEYPEVVLDLYGEGIEYVEEYLKLNY